MTVATAGRPWPEGATPTAEGTNFALYSESATAVYVCLFDESDRETRVPLTARTAHVWHGFIPGVTPGQRYGFRVDGPWDLLRGHRFNPQKLLVDPYARALEGKTSYQEGAIFDYQRDGRRSEVDSAPFVPRSIVISGDFDWENDAPPRTAWCDTILYEAHVKNLTARHPEVPEALRGTYLGVASAPVIAHLKSLGVTALELMPIHEVADEPGVALRHQKNHWGYSTLGYFAPDQRFMSRQGASRKGDQVREFKAMVKALHAAGIEVILDVVYNHTCEGDESGPTLFLRGIDNRVYYMLRDQGAHTADVTGCGNSVQIEHHQALKLVCDSLRYWVTEMHVDGFRFDLATELGREGNTFSAAAAFFRAIHQDPVLSRVKLIAEPWDLGPDGMQLGAFPPPWREWNARFRDGMRRFWNGHEKSLSDLGYRLTGSSDLFRTPGRTPTCGINFVTAHDGFTLRDLVSYAKKHNLANGENDRDGTDDNASANFGVEGETVEPSIREARARQMRNFLAMLFLTPGVPMLSSGDEMGKTQKGNNNPYVLDDETSHLDWSVDEESRGLRAYCAALVRLRKQFPALRRERFFDGEDIQWLDPAGQRMDLEDWGTPEIMALSAVVAPVPEDSTHILCFILNGNKTEVGFRLPSLLWETSWNLLLDTREPGGHSSLTPVSGDPISESASLRGDHSPPPRSRSLQAGAAYTMPPHSFALWVASKPLGQ